MSLTLALNNALSGLAVSQSALTTVSNNIANVNTEGYSRQYVEQSSRVIGGVGSGVEINTISRKVDQYLEGAVQKNTTNVGYNTVLDDYYSRMQIMMGQPGSQNSISNYVDNFFNAMQSLAQTPNLASFRQTAVNSADSLSKEMSSLASSLEDLRYQADQDITTAVDNINDEIAHLEDVNRSITRADATHASKASLFDDRDATIKKLAHYMDLQLYYQSDGRVNVATANGISIVDDIGHELRYTPSKGKDDFINGVTVSELTVHSLDEHGNETGVSRTLISGGVSRDISTVLTGGSLKALHELRDNLIPDVLDQLDQIAANVRDQVNAIHNQGAGFPPSTVLAGGREVNAQDAYDWTGKVRIGAVNPDGSPANSTYVDESYTGYRPLTLDLATLDGGLGAGTPTVEAIINEINNHFNAPPWKAESGNLNNIQIVSDNKRLPNAAVPTFTFDLDSENISKSDTDMWVTNVQVLDDTATNITNVSDTLPKVTVDPTNTYSFTAGSDQVVINTTTAHNFGVGQWIYLQNPGGLPATVGGGSIPSTDLVGFFKVIGVPGTNSFTIEAAHAASATVTQGGFGSLNALPKYDQIDAGEKSRSRDKGTITATLGGPGGNATSAYYDVTVTVALDNRDGNSPSYSDLTYRVYNRTENILNHRYDVTSVSGAATKVFPTSPQQYIRAVMVDKEGHELLKTNGSYGEQDGYLKLIGNTIGETQYSVAVDELDSKQLGVISQTPHEDGTNRGFSHFFDLNDFFKSNAPTATGDAIKNSAINMAVTDNIMEDPSRVSAGNLSQTHQPADPTKAALYTYEVDKGDNTVAQRMADLQLKTIQFDAAGGLPKVNLSFNGYSSQVLANFSSVSSSAESVLSNSKALLDGFAKRADSYKGVNLDEELANTTIYQNAYSASARIIKVTDELYQSLLDAF